MSVYTARVIGTRLRSASKNLTLSRNAGNASHTAARLAGGELVMVKNYIMHPH